MSRLRFPLVICACALFWALLGLLLGGLFRHALAGLIWGGLFGIGYVVIGSWAAEKFPQDVWGAKLLENEWAPNLYEMLHALCDRMEIPLPTLYSVPVAAPNAFVVASRDGNASLIVTNGLTRHLDKEEVQAVAALMMARLATGVMPDWTTAATLAGMPIHAGLLWRRRRGLAWLGSAVLLVFALPAAWLIRLAWSEGVVTAADYHAAHLAEMPLALKTALEKMEAARAVEDTTGGGKLPGNPATALLFAVPPLPAAGFGPGLETRLLAAFPPRPPDAAARAARFLDAPAPLPAEPEGR